MKYISFFILLILISCVNREKKEKIEKLFDAFYEKTLDDIIEKSNGQSIEFRDLYQELADKIPDDKDEKLILVQKLKTRGFEVTNYERGNYPPLGPRIIIVNMKKKNCECEVSKKYYSTNSDSLYRMSETVNCKKIRD